MFDQLQLEERLRNIQSNLEHYEQDIGVLEKDTLVRVFVRIIPRLFGAERCGIFFFNPNEATLWSKYGTELEEGELEITTENSIAGQVLKSGTTYSSNELRPKTLKQNKAPATTGFIPYNILCTPIRSESGGQNVGVIQVLNKPKGFTSQDSALIEDIRTNLFTTLQAIWLRERVATTTKALSNDVALASSQLEGQQALVATDPAMVDVIRSIVSVSATPANVLLRGENGTGKEVAARLIRRNSNQPEAPFVAVNCAAIPENLLESQFFGYEKGAFTGAERAQGGFFEEAQDGILFLDEIGDLSLPMQAKLLRALQEKEGRRLGGQEVIPYRFRLLSATNRDLSEMVQAGTFREDLFYRLFAVAIDLPPLRERQKDIPLLAMRFLREIGQTWGKTFKGFEPEAILAFERFPWPGNVRQLRREIERIAALAGNTELIGLQHCSEELREHAMVGKRYIYRSGESLKHQLARVERTIIDAALEANDGHRDNTAKALGITRQTLHNKMKSF